MLKLTVRQVKITDSFWSPRLAIDDFYSAGRLLTLGCSRGHAGIVTYCNYFATKLRPRMC